MKLKEKYNKLEEKLLKAISAHQQVIVENGNDYFMDVNDPRYVELIKEINRIGDQLTMFVKKTGYTRKLPTIMATPKAFRGIAKEIKTEKIELKTTPMSKIESDFERAKRKFAEDKKKYEEIITQGLTKEIIREMLRENDYFVCLAIEVIYKNNQTMDEQATKMTQVNNSIGFNGVDAPFLSSLAIFFNERGYLTAKQISSGRRAVKKYFNQIYNLWEKLC
jgi:hypothetical protein